MLQFDNYCLPDVGAAITKFVMQTYTYTAYVRTHTHCARIHVCI